MLKKLTKRLATTFKKGASLNPRINLAIFVLMFAGIGGIFLLFSSGATPAYAPNPPHAAQCIENSPSKTVVRPGEVFTARIQIKNVGSSTYSSAFGTALSDYRDGASIWNASGLGLSGNVPPGSIALFNLTLKAPTTPGTYPFQWGMAIALTGFIQNPCTGKTVTVANPPVVSLLANGSSSNITLTQGNSLTIGWSASNTPSSCVASGSWGGNKDASGSENHTGDTSSAGKKTYILTCTNGAGSGSATRQVTVNSPPSQPSTNSGGSSTPQPSQSTHSKPSSKPSGSSSGSSSDQGQTSLQSAPAEPPTPPTDFSATPTDDSVVNLTWSKPTFNGIVSSYELERSTDNTNWTKLGDSITDNAYTDTSVSFQTTYYYRILTVDDIGQKSDYALSQVTTQPFNPNLTTEDLTLTNAEQSVTVLIPRSAFSGDAKCSLISDYNVISPSKNKYEVFAGPYQILCKSINGDTIQQFNQPLTITVKTGSDKFNDVLFYTYTGDKWQEQKGATTNNISTLQLQNSTRFAVLAHKAGTPLIVKVILTIFIVSATVVGILLILNLVGKIKQRRALQHKNEDYYHKEHGF